MDLSAVQSGSKCSSDFSIERILSEEGRTREESGCGSLESGALTRSWLWCTRYQPPRIPRAASSSACRSRRSGRHARVPFTAAQAAALEAAYARAPYLAPPALRALAAALQLRDDRIKIWFQNRRARERREKCASICPPQPVTLPPTTVLPSGAIFSSSWQSFKAVHTSSDSSSQVHDLPHSPVAFTSKNHRHRGTFSKESDDRSMNRPETPLDVETVEDSVTN